MTSGLKIILSLAIIAQLLDVLLASGGVCIDYRSFCSSHWLADLQERDASIKSWTNINLAISARPVYFNEHKADTKPTHNSLSSVVCPKRTVEFKQLDLEVVKSDELCFKTTDSFNGNIEIIISIKHDKSDKPRTIYLEGIVNHKVKHPGKLNKLHLISKDSQVPIPLLTYAFTCEANYFRKFCSVHCDEDASSTKNESSYKCDTKTGEKICVGDACERRGKRSIRAGRSVYLHHDLPTHYRYTFESKNFRQSFVHLRNREAWLDKEKSTEEYILDSSFVAVPGISGTGISFKSRRGYLRHRNGLIFTHPFENTRLFREDASWNVRNGLADKYGYSLESVNYPGFFMRHSGYRFRIAKDSSQLFKDDATFYLRILIHHS